MNMNKDLTASPPAPEMIIKPNSASNMPTDTKTVVTLSDTSKNLGNIPTFSVDSNDKKRTLELEAPGGFIPILEAAGGSDKDPLTGHRRDTIPIREAIEKKGCKSVVLTFREENAISKSGLEGEEVEKLNNEARAHNDALRYLLLEGELSKVDALIVRNNPGTLTSKTQAKLDAMLIELDQKEVSVMSHPEVIKRMGGKDALCKISHLKCGLEDTMVYYTEDALRDGFRKTIAFRPRVIKQNRGSQGEGIWICKLKNEEKYCKSFGDRIADLDEVLVLMEANDNHIEEHTVGEFLEFCLNGRTASSGEWTSLGTGKYLEGGVEAGAMLVDQRFLPRIVEGEVRCLMVGSKLVQIVHKKPKDGCLSATLQSGAIYTTYKPDHPQFSNLVESFQQDLPIFMDAFGMGDQPLPLLWTADYIYGDKDENGKDTFHVGEFNCSCVGITKQLELSDLVGQTAIDIAGIDMKNSADGSCKKKKNDSEM